MARGVLLALSVVLGLACGHPPAPPRAEPPREASATHVARPAPRDLADAGPFTVPALQGRVNDLAGVLSIDARAAFEKELEDFDHRTTNEIVVLILPSLEGHAVEYVAYATFNTWKLGKRAKNNGVLLVVTTADRRMRIETGLGLEKTLTDARASEILGTMKPDLRNERYEAAIRTGIAGIEATLNGS